jgi:hypothetical protein
MKRAIAAITILGLCGCAAQPKVRPSLVRAPEDVTPQQFESYALQENIAVITAAETGEGANRKTTVSAALQRQDHQAVRIALTASDPLGVRTAVTIKRFDNTDIPSEIAVKVEDNRVALINQAGGVLTSLIGLAAHFEAPTNAQLPLRLNLSQRALGDDGRPTRRQAIVNGTGFQIVYGPIAPDAIETATLSAQPAGPWFYYAACRTADISVRYEGKSYSFSYRVSDPNYLQRARMPIEGTITMHSQCGASVSGRLTGDGVGPALSIAAALLAQAEAVRAAAQPEH